MELYCEVHAGTGPYLLLVHGFLSSRAQWRPNLAALARVSRPVVVELWGHSHSPSPDDPALYAPDTYMQLFDQLRQRLGVERLLLCGQSLGAALTLRYALTYPDRVIAQVFTNSAAALLADAKLHSPRGIAQTLRYTTPNVPVRDRVRDLRVPTLLVCGEREKRFAANRAFAERQIPALQVVGTPAGHAVNIEAAAEFNTAVSDFVARHTETGL